MPAWLLSTALLAASGQPQPVPFDFIKSHVFVEARLNGHRGLWLVDTGANTTVISARAATLAKCRPINVRVERDPYGITHFVAADRLQIGAVAAPLRIVGVLPRLADRILKTDGVFVDGILAYDWLKNYRLTIDYRAHRLTLASPGAPAKSAPGRSVVAMDVVNGVPMVPVSINKGPARLCLVDTGANVVSIRWDLAKASGIKPGDPAVAPGPRVRSLRAAENTQAVVLDRLRIGGLIFGNVPVSLYEDTHMPWVFGKIGNGLFEPFRLTLDARNKQVILER